MTIHFIKTGSGQSQGSVSEIEMRMALLCAGMEGATDAHSSAAFSRRQRLNLYLLR
jgi:hypothetical protein